MTAENKISDIKIFIGSDHAGFELKEKLKAYLVISGIPVEDVGTFTKDSCDYPLIAKKLCEKLLASTGPSIGILVCGTGAGMSMAANRHPRIRAAVCTSEYMAVMARRHNDANVLCLGRRVVGDGMAESIVMTFLLEGFEGDRHARRIAQIDA